MKKFWMIVNITAIIEIFSDCEIPEYHAPRYVYFNKDRAEQELIRLQTKYKNGKFVLLEAVAQFLPHNTNPKAFWMSPIE